MFVCGLSLFLHTSEVSCYSATMLFKEFLYHESLFHVHIKMFLIKIKAKLKGVSQMARRQIQKYIWINQLNIIRGPARKLRGK